MDSKTIVMCVVALLLGMLLANMLKSVCGCKTVEGNEEDCVNQVVIAPFMDRKAENAANRLCGTHNETDGGCYFVRTQGGPRCVWSSGEIENPYGTMGH